MEDKFEIKRMNAIRKELDEIAALHGEPDLSITFEKSYYDVYAVYKQKADDFGTSRYFIHSDATCKGEDFKEQRLVVDISDYAPWEMVEQLLRFTIATNSHPDEGWSTWYECKQGLLFHKKGWRPDATVIAAA